MLLRLILFIPLSVISTNATHCLFHLDDLMYQILDFLPLRTQLMAIRRVCDHFNQLSHSMHETAMRSITEFEELALNDSMRIKPLPDAAFKMQIMYFKLIKIPLFTLRFPSFLRRFQGFVRSNSIVGPIGFHNNLRGLNPIWPWYLHPVRFGWSQEQVLARGQTKYLRLVSYSQIISLHLMTGGSTESMSIKKFKYHWLWHKLNAMNDTATFLENGHYVRWNEEFLTDLRFNDYDLLLKSYEEQDYRELHKWDPEMFASFLVTILDDKYFNKIHHERTGLSLTLRHLAQLPRDTMYFLQRNNRHGVLQKILPKLMRLDKADALRILWLHFWEFDVKYHEQMVENMLIVSDESNNNRVSRMICPCWNYPPHQCSVSKETQMGWILNMIRLHEKYNLMVSKREWLAEEIWGIGECVLQERPNTTQPRDIQFIRTLLLPSMFGKGDPSELSAFLHTVKASSLFKRYLFLESLLRTQRLERLKQRIM